MIVIEDSKFFEQIEVIQEKQLRKLVGEGSSLEPERDTWFTLNEACEYLNLSNLFFIK